MAGHAQLKFVMTECSKTQIRLTGLIYSGSGVLFVLKRVFVSFPLRFRFVYVAFRFLPFLRTFLTKNAF